MAKLTVLYTRPADEAAFMKYYNEKHIPIAKKIPGLRSYTINSGPVNNADGSASPYILIANLGFDSLAALQTALGSPEGAAAAGDLGNFASAGAALYVYEEKSV
ncbi:MAG: EthD family reductase [Vulcanimicrobiaceae bacterium]